MNIEHVSTDMFQPEPPSPPLDGRKNVPGNALVLRRRRRRWPHRTLTTRYGAALALLVSALLAACESPGPSRWAPRPPEGPTNTFPLPPAGSDVVGDIWAIVARREDTLPDLARRFDLGYEEIAAANPGVDIWLPGRGTKVLLPTEFVLPDAPREGLVLNLASMRLFYYPPTGPDGTPTVVTHPIGIGREGWATPQGKTKVVSKKAQPSWTVPASILAEHAANGDRLPPVVPPGPDNPLGDYAMRLGIPGYLIHGTSKPYGVGMRVSHGCIRLYPEDIERLFPEVSVGTPVRIVNQPYLAGWKSGVLYVEAHPPLEEDAARWKSSLKPMERVVKKKLRDSGAGVDWKKAGQAAREARGIPVPISPGAPTLSQMLAAVPVVRNDALAASRPPSAGWTLRRSRSDWYVQVGSFREEHNARRLAAALSRSVGDQGAHTVRHQGLYRVVSGPYANLSEAQSEELRIRRELGADTLILDAEQLPIR